jgi:hypothetical protein
VTAARPMCRFIKLMPLRQWHVCMLAHTFVLLIAAAGAAADTPTKVCRTSAHGAKPSASRYATQQLQAAIDECGGDSCGRVVVDRPGAYLTASLRLSGCVHLELPASVTLLAGSQVRNAVQPATPVMWLIRHAQLSMEVLHQGHCLAALADGAAYSPINRRCSCAACLLPLAACHAAEGGLWRHAAGMVPAAVPKLHRLQPERRRNGGWPGATVGAAAAGHAGAAAEGSGQAASVCRPAAAAAPGIFKAATQGGAQLGRPLLPQA